MLANVITYPQPTFVTKPADLLDGDVLLDARSRKCAVRRQANGKLSLVKPRSGVAHDYSLPKGGKLQVIGRVEGGWSPVSPQVAKPSPKATKKVAAKRQPRKAHTTQASNGEALVAIADMLDAASAALRTVATLV